MLFEKPGLFRPKTLLAVPLVAALATTSGYASETNGYATILAGLYGPLDTDSSVTSTQTECSQCHLKSTTSSFINSAAFTTFGAILDGGSGGVGTISSRIQSAAETGATPFVPRVSGPTVFKVPANSGPQTIDLTYYGGRSNLGSTTHAAGSGFAYAADNATPSFPFIFDVNGDLTATSQLAAGTMYSFEVVPKNPSMFRPLQSANLPTVTVSVNQPPTIVAAATDPTTYDDNAGVISFNNLLSSTYITDGDPLVGVTDPDALTVTAITDENGAGVPANTYTLGASFSAGGTLSFNAAGLDALTNGQSRTITFTYTVSDGYDMATNTYTVTVDGVSETGSNIPATATPRTIVLSEDAAVPTSINLLQGDDGAAFTDADGDALSVDRFVDSLAGLPQFSRAGDVFSVTDLSSFQALSAGQTEAFSFTYVIEERRSATERYETSNTLSVTINGANDPLTASGFSDDLDESIILSTYNLINLTGAVDPDANDQITGTNLRDITPDRALRNPEQFKISDDGQFLQISPAFQDSLDVGETATVTATLDMIDGQGAAVPVTVTFTVTGVEAGHGAQAGLYANSLAARYPLAGFQQAASQPAACFTCHTPAAALFSAKPDCGDTVAFTSYGRQLCEDDRGGPFGPRLARQEAAVSPQILEANIQRFLSSDVGATDPTPIQVDPGKTVDGAPSSIHSFYIEDDMGGAFVISPAGIVQATQAVLPGDYVLQVLPLNISGSKTAGGAVRDVAGFYPLNAGPTTVTVTVTESRPVVVDDTANTEQDTPVTFGVIDNDVGGGVVRAVAIATPPANGAVVVGADLSLTYTPDAGFVGTETFTYRGSNTSGDALEEATVTVEVIASGGLVANGDVSTTAIGRAVSVAVLDNDVNAQAGSTVVTLVSVPDAATVGATSVTGQSITFTPVPSFGGTAEIVYEATNPGGAGSRATLHINVVEVGTGAITAALDDPQLKQVAAAFEASCSIVAGSSATDTQTTAFLASCANLNAAATANEDLQQAIMALQNEENLATVTAVRTIARGLGRAVSARMANIRNGSARGFDFEGLTISLGGERLPNDVLVAMAQSIIGIREPRFRATGGFGDVDPIWSGFISGDIAFTEKDAQGRNAGFDLVTTNLTLGVDYDLQDGRTIGVALGYSQSDTDFAGGGGLKGKGLQATVYGVVEDFIRPGLTFEGYVSVGKVKFKSSRRILFTAGGAAVDTFANASFDVDYLNISPRLSYTNTYLQTGDRLGDLTTGLKVTWFGQLDLLVMRLGGYTETGGAGLALTTQGQTYKSLLLSLGVDVSRPVYLGPDVTAEIFGTLSVNGELLDKTRSLTSSFAVAGPGAPTFTVSEPGANGIGGTVEIGTKITTRAGATTEIRLGHDFSSDGVRTSRVGVSWSRSIFGNDRLALGYDRNFAARNADTWNANLDYQIDF